MKLHRADVSYMDGVMVFWGASKRQVEREAAKACTEHDGTFLRLVPVDVPTDRAGLVAWLNSNLGTDNG